MRSRNIKPGFFKNEDLVSLPFEYRILYQGLWCLADREGKLEDRPFQIKMDVFPADNVDINAGLDKLHGLKLILRYEIAGKKYIKIPTFKEHQNPHPKEKCRHIPNPINDKPSNLNTSQEIKQTDPAESLLLNPDILNPESLLPELPPRERLKPITQEIFDYWKTELNHPKAILDTGREKKIRARLREGYSVERIKQAIRGIKRSSHHMGDNDRKTVYDDIELICREGKNVDQFADLEENQGQTQNLNTKSVTEKFLELRKQQREKEAGNA